MSLLLCLFVNTAAEAKNILAGIDDSLVQTATAQPRDLHTPWIGIEAGTHGGDKQSDDIEEGFYSKIFVELPFSNHVGMLAFADLVKSMSMQSYGFGLGLTVNQLIDGKSRISMGLIFFGQERMVGLLIPVSASYELVNNRFRIQGSAAYRTAGEFSPASHHSQAFWTCSIGLAFNLKKPE